MSNDPKQTLQYIINTYGMAVIDDQRKLKGLLMDLCGNHPREVKLLSLSLAEGAVHKLLSYKTLPIEAAIKLSAKILEDSVGMSKEAALWAMETWAEACGLVDFPGKFTNTLQMEFVLIPAGTFMMGSPEDEHDRCCDETLHQVTISRPFYLQTTQVTQGQWKKVMGNNPSYFKGDDNLPVEQVSCNDVQDFIGRLNRQEETDKYRLPTEAEWEYSCRAGSRAAFCFGSSKDDLGEYEWYSNNDLGEHAWYKYNSGAKTHSVGNKQPNSWGLYDMHGNVWEWVQDWYGEKFYDESPKVNPGGPASGQFGVLRGGAWSSIPLYVRAANRRLSGPAYRTDNVGFRLLRSVAVSDSSSTDKSTSACDAIETGRDGRFIAYNNGTVLDAKTNLMWATRDNGSSINWANAQSYCENYRGGGYADWRMPTQEELAGVYDSSKSYKLTQQDYNVKLTKLIQLSRCSPWASETCGSDAAFFGFTNGQRGWHPQSFDDYNRALPVRCANRLFGQFLLSATDPIETQGVVSTL